MGQVIAAKATGVAVSNTSLVQCDKTHLAAFNDVDASKTVSPLVTVTFLQQNSFHTKNWHVQWPFAYNFAQSSV